MKRCLYKGIHNHKESLLVPDKKIFKLFFLKKSTIYFSGICCATLDWWFPIQAKFSNEQVSELWHQGEFFSWWDHLEKNFWADFSNSNLRKWLLLTGSRFLVVEKCQKFSKLRLRKIAERKKDFFQKLNLKFLSFMNETIWMARVSTSATRIISGTYQVR